MTYALDGRVAVVTGGSRGLGLAIARLLGRGGARVVIAARDGDALERARLELEGEGLRVTGQACEVTDRDSVLALRDSALKQTGRLDIWVNNAGVAGVFGPVHRVPEESFATTTDTIVRGTYLGSLAALDAMLRHGGGDLINLLGRGDDGPVANQAAYGAAKAWVRAFTGALAAEHKGTGVRVHAFNPGLVRTDLLGRITAVSGYRERLQPLAAVFGVLGVEPDVAAQPILRLLGSTRPEYRATNPWESLRRAGGSLLRHASRTPATRLDIVVEDVPDRVSTLS